MATNTTSKLFFLTFLTISYLISTVHIITIAHARNLQTTTVATDHSGAGNLMDCWNAGLELKSCTEEIVEFFLSRTGTTVSSVGIDKDCCGAIGLVVKDCWSVMFTSLGLTNMEGPDNSTGDQTTDVCKDIKRWLLDMDEKVEKGAAMLISADMDYDTILEDVNAKEHLTLLSSCVDKKPPGVSNVVEIYWPWKVFLQVPLDVPIRKEVRFKEYRRDRDRRRKSTKELRKKLRKKEAKDRAK
ncbi:hypothetical protein AALP_AA8G480500 [Arabis alpina]|uniref:Prolamin-like domain-containing protein n=1 Tax=Arabis alpina TaxID=50452 RepID=A0A087GE59_ARAAL|nr:hypothetical protein AALP_AA8G480500 [Arabis alpina]